MPLIDIGVTYHMKINVSPFFSTLRMAALPRNPIYSRLYEIG